MNRRSPRNQGARCPFARRNACGFENYFTHWWSLAHRRPWASRRAVPIQCSTRARLRLALATRRQRTRAARATPRQGARESLARRRAWAAAACRRTVTMQVPQEKARLQVLRVGTKEARSARSTSAALLALAAARREAQAARRALAQTAATRAPTNAAPSATTTAVTSRSVMAVVVGCRRASTAFARRWAVPTQVRRRKLVVWATTASRTIED